MRQQSSANLFLSRFILGFTLIELLICLVIIALLSVLSVSYVYRYDQTIKLEQASANLLAFLRQVQQEAQWFNRSYQLIYSTNDLKNHSLTFSERHHAFYTLHLETQQPIPHLTYYWKSADITLTTENNTLDTIFYGKRNMATSGHLTLTNRAGAIKIIISSMGRIRHCWLSSVSPPFFIGIALC